MRIGGRFALGRFRKAARYGSRFNRVTMMQSGAYTHWRILAEAADNLTNQWEVNTYEILFYDRVLTAQEVTYVTNCLYTKHGITP